MALKIEYKNIFRRSFKNLAELKQYEFESEEELFKMIDQIAETIFECQNNKNQCYVNKVYQNYLIKQDLANERNKALELKAKVVGI